MLKYFSLSVLISYFSLSAYFTEDTVTVITIERSVSHAHQVCHLSVTRLLLRRQILITLGTELHSHPKITAKIFGLVSYLSEQSDCHKRIEDTPFRLVRKIVNSDS